MKLFITVLIAVFLFTGQAGYVQAKFLEKAAPAESTDFIAEEMMDKPDDLPFQKFWKRTGASLENYSKIFIAPINTDYLVENGWWKDLGMKDVESDIVKIADKAQDTIIQAFKNDPERRFTVVSGPQADTLVLEMAITELVPNKAGFQAALTAASMGTGELAVSAASAVGGSLGSKSSIAFEMRIRDGETNEVIGMIADREEEQVSIVNVKNYTWYGDVNAIIKTWANQFVQVANRTPGEVIADTPVFTFKLW